MTEQTHRRALSALPLTCATALALVLICQSLWAIHRFWDIFPFGDMVDVVWRYLARPTREFWIFHDNEHLPLAAMPFYWIDLRVFKAQGTFLICCIVLLAFAISLVPLAAVRRALPGRNLLVATIACCAVAMQLWLGGYANLIWTKQVHMYLSLFAVMMALSLACDARPRRWFHVAGACAWAAIAMFSFGYGIMAFAVLLALGAWRRWPLPWLVSIPLVAVCCLVLYVALSSSDLGQHVRVLSSFGLAASQALYATTFVASPIFNGLQPFLPAPAAFGLAYAAVALSSAWLAAFVWRRRRLPPCELAAWGVALALFTVLTAVQTACARFFYGFAQAADPRYVIGQMPFWLGVLLVALSCGASPRRVRAIGLAACAGMALLLASQQSVFAVMRAHNYGRWSSAMSAIDGVLDPAVAVRDDLFHVSRVPQMIAGLRAHGWSVFAWRQARWIGRQVQSFGAVRTGCAGAFDTLVPVGGKASPAMRGFLAPGWRAEGWAVDHGTDARSSWILLADGTGVVRGLAHGGGARSDVTAALHAPAEVYPGWTGYVPEGAHGAGLSAWLLTPGKHPCRLGVSPPVPS